MQWAEPTPVCKFSDADSLRSYLKKQEQRQSVDIVTAMSQLIVDQTGKTADGYLLRPTAIKSMAPRLCPGLSRVVQDLLHPSQERGNGVDGVRAATAVWNQLVSLRWQRLEGYQLLRTDTDIDAAAGPDTIVISRSDYLDLFLGVVTDIVDLRSQAFDRRVVVRADCGGRGIVLLADESNRTSVRVFASFIENGRSLLFPVSSTRRRGVRFVPLLTRRLSRAATYDMSPVVDAAKRLKAVSDADKVQSVSEFGLRLAASLRSVTGLPLAGIDAVATRITDNADLQMCRKLTRFDVAMAVADVAKAYDSPTREAGELMAARLCKETR